MANKSFLTAPEKQDLMRFVAASGENYERYHDWCNERKVPAEKRFSPDYFHRWVSRRRERIRVLREEHHIEVRKASTLDKEKRIKLLEESVDRLTDAIANENDTATLLKLEEQLGKQLDRIAKERGEFAKEAAATDPTRELNKALAAEALKFLQAAPPQIEPPVDGVYTELPADG